MPEAYVICEWVQRQTEEGVENVPRLSLEYRRTGLSYRDATAQEGPKIDNGHFVCLYVEAPQSLLNELDADPLYRVVQTRGKLSKAERDDLGAHFKEEVEKIKPDADRKELVDVLCEKFRSQQKAVK